MPNPSFEPIIGSGFDALAQQRMGWAAMNNQVDAGNAEREMQAQREAQQFALSLAQMQQQQTNADRDRQLAERQAYIQQTNIDSDRAMKAAQFDVNASLTKDQIQRQQAGINKQIEKQREATDEKAREFNASMEQAKQDKVDEIENTGAALASAYASSGRQLSQAEQNADKLQSEHDDLTKFLKDETARKDKDPDDLKVIAETNARLAELKKLVPKALSIKNQFEQKHLALSDNLQARGFVTDDANGTLTHLGTGKSWSYKTALKNAQAQSEAFDYFGANNPDPDNPETRTATGGGSSPNVAPTATTSTPSDVVPPAPVDKTQREVNRIYLTPKGPMKWLGNGWQPVATGNVSASQYF